MMALEEGVNFRANPFYDHNVCENFLAVRDGKPVGRICALVNYGHIERFQEQRGFLVSSSVMTIKKLRRCCSMRRLSSWSVKV